MFAQRVPHPATVAEPCQSCRLGLGCLHRGSGSLNAARVFIWSWYHLLMSASQQRRDPSWSSLSILPLYSVVDFPTSFKHILLEIGKWRRAKKRNLKCRLITKSIGLVGQSFLLKKIMGKKKKKNPPTCLRFRLVMLFICGHTAVLRMS